MTRELKAQAAATAVDLMTASPAGTLTKLGYDFFHLGLQRAGDRKTRRAVQVLIDQWAAVGKLSVAEAHEAVEKLCQSGDPDADDMLHDMFRSMVLARSGASWPLIARLTAEYQQQGRAPDRYFRRVGRLLMECEDHDIEMIRIASNLTRDLLARTRERGREPETVYWSEYTAGGIDVLVESIPDQQNMNKDSRAIYKQVGLMAHHNELTDLLVRSRLGNDGGHAAVFPLLSGLLQPLIELFADGSDYENAEVVF